MTKGNPREAFLAAISDKSHMSREIVWEYLEPVERGEHRIYENSNPFFRIEGTPFDGGIDVVASICPFGHPCGEYKWRVKK